MADRKKQQTERGGGTIRIQYYRSSIASPKTQKEIVRSLGLTKLNQIVERPDTPVDARLRRQSAAPVADHRVRVGVNHGYRLNNLRAPQGLDA